jgi:hypothetical protein
VGPNNNANGSNDDDVDAKSDHGFVSDPESQPDEVPEMEEAGDVGELDLDADVVDLNHHKLIKIDERIQQLRCVEVLTLRWNLIKKIENLSALVTLTELELYDNQITVIENLDGLVNLE